MEIAIGFLMFVLIVLLGYLLYYYAGVYGEKKGIAHRIRKEATLEDDAGVSRLSSATRFLRETLARLGASVRPEKEKDISRIRKKLFRAGFHGENHLVFFFGFKVAAAVMLPLCLAIAKITLMGALNARHFMLLLLAVTAAGFYLPDFYVQRKAAARKQKIFESFPDALDLMVICVEAGMGLDSAIKRVGDEMTLKSKELSEEFSLLSLELRAGKPRIEALRNLAIRTDLEDVSSLVTLLIQTDKFGTRVGQALRVHSDSMRIKRFQLAEEIAAKLPVKIVFPLILFIFPALFVTILGPAAIKIYRNLIIQ